MIATVVTNRVKIMGDAEDVDRELLRGEVVHLVRHLHSERVDISGMAASRLKDLVLASNPAQRRNQDLIAGVDGAIDGLVNIARYLRRCLRSCRCCYKHPRAHRMTLPCFLFCFHPQTTRHGSKDGKYFACYALAQMAWSNQRNSVLIPSVSAMRKLVCAVLALPSPHTVKAQRAPLQV